ncbi:MAG TPA: transcription antitermination factor NusB [Solirubrobacterales bacterium]|nr:transcription antitermination factor NusB [Solirubrobacterales bacterium]
MSAEVSGARRAAFEVLRRTFEHDAWADRALISAVERHRLDPRQRAQAQRLAYGAVKRRGSADHIVAELARRPAEDLDPPVVAALRLGVYELVWAAGTPDYAAVDQAVELAKGGLAASGAARGRARAASGLVNAVLRRAATDAGGILAAIDDRAPEGAAAVHSYPRWLADLWWAERGADRALSLMRAMNEPAETALRVNTLRADPARVAEELRETGAEIDGPFAGEDPLHPREALVARGPLGDGIAPRISLGELVPQSRGSQAVVALLDPQPGERVLDLCAGPGIKTTAIAARIEDRGEIVAVELDPGRAAQVADRCGLTGASSVRVEIADAAVADLGSEYDRVLVDPPCSDLGTLASRPDARWRKSPEAISRLAGLQARILARAASALRPGGALVYSTCTLSRSENEDVVAAALAAGEGPALAADDLGGAHPSLASAVDGRFLELRPDRDRTSGFFIARLRRTGR